MRIFALVVCGLGLLSGCVKHQGAEAPAGPPVAQPPKPVLCKPGYQPNPALPEGRSSNLIICLPAEPMATKCPTVNGKKFCLWQAAHADFVAKHLTGDMYAAELGDLCPKSKTQTYDGIADTWGALIKCTAQAESGFDPELGFQESFTDAATKAPAISIGLMQLSLGDKLNYHGPYCSALTVATLKDPETNLGCAIEITTALINRRQGSLRFRLGGDRDAHRGYWSTIRDHKIDACLKAERPSCF